MCMHPHKLSSTACVAYIIIIIILCRIAYRRSYYLRTVLLYQCMSLAVVQATLYAAIPPQVAAEV